MWCSIVSREVREMIKINNKTYICKSFEHSKVENVEHLLITVEGELKTNRNKIHIDYGNKSYFGCKVLPHFDGYTTKFLVYIFKKGDKELG